MSVVTLMLWRSRRVLPTTIGIYNTTTMSSHRLILSSLAVDLRFCSRCGFTVWSPNGTERRASRYFVWTAPGTEPQGAVQWQFRREGFLGAQGARDQSGDTWS